MNEHDAAAGTHVAAERLERATVLSFRVNRLMEALLEREADDRLALPDPEVVGRAFHELGQALLDDPECLTRMQMHLWLAHGQLWRAQVSKLFGGMAPAVIQPDRSDRRFKDAAWTRTSAFDWLKQSYLINARWLEKVVADASGLDRSTRERIGFYVRQAVDALAPTNFALTNPTVLARAAETSGESLLDGLERLLDDMERDPDAFTPAMSPTYAFKPGVDVAASPGAVIFRNELIELIQYSPSTPMVAKIPLLIVPPWINKFYVLDLRPENSFVRWAVAQGLTVFMISWVNPDEALAGKSFEDYLAEGPLAAMDAIEQQILEPRVDLLGFCLGGTLATCLLAHLAAAGRSKRVRSAALLACMIDFAEPGEIGVFIDEQQVRRLERHMEKTGYLEASYMKRAFAMLRANDLIWSFAVNNYLMGQAPKAFDLLHWNADGTRMPSRMHAFYLREMYLENRLIEPGGIRLLGTALELKKIQQPVFFLSTTNDHIVPWQSTYAGIKHFGGPVEFVLGGSGHIAGVINSASSGKYGYRTGCTDGADPKAWLDGSVQHQGSWWPCWRAWLADLGGEAVAARDPVDGGLEVLGAAPGQYVSMQAGRGNVPDRPQPRREASRPA